MQRSLRWRFEGSSRGPQWESAAAEGGKAAAYNIALVVVVLRCIGALIPRPLFCMRGTIGVCFILLVLIAFLLIVKAFSMK